MAATEDHLTEFAYRQVNYCRIVVPGPPTGKGRPRFDPRTGRAYTPKGTRLAEGVVRDAWTHAGCPRLPDGPVAMTVVAVMARPKGHRTAKGLLNKKGKATPRPTKKPDFDNVAKLIGDALNRHAYHDDAQIVEVGIVKRWATGSEDECMQITLESLIPTVA